MRNNSHVLWTSCSCCKVCWSCLLPARSVVAGNEIAARSDVDLPVTSGLMKRSFHEHTRFNSQRSGDGGFPKTEGLTPKQWRRWFRWMKAFLAARSTLTCPWRVVVTNSVFYSRFQCESEVRRVSFYCCFCCCLEDGRSPRACLTLLGECPGLVAVQKSKSKMFSIHSSGWRSIAVVVIFACRLQDDLAVVPMIEVDSGWLTPNPCPNTPTLSGCVALAFEL